MTDGSGARALAYDPVSDQLQAETYSSGLLSGVVIGRTYDSLYRASGVPLTSGRLAVGCIMHRNTNQPLYLP